jgi:hypothetical protein
VTFVTAGRVGSVYKRHKHFMVMHIGVKLYELKTGRDGISRFKYVGAVEGTVTLDRFIRTKKERLAKEHAKKIDGVYLQYVKHNDKAPPLYALAVAME